MQQAPKTTVIHRSGTAAIIGRSNVGKSTLLNAALKEQLAIVTPTPQTTRDRILGVVRHGDAQIALLDTPGFHRPANRLGRRMNAAAREAILGADVMVFMTAISTKHLDNPRPHPGDTTLLSDLGSEIPAVLVVNKIDLCRDKRALLPLLEGYSKIREFAAVVPISAMREDGVDLVLKEIASLLPQRGPAYDEDFLTDRPLRFFASEYVREALIRATSQEVPHAVAVTVERFDETPTVVHVEATIHCARVGQRAIIVGHQGLKLKEIGIAARQRIEALLERQVNLKLWVKVKDGWQDSRTAMMDLGYGQVQDDGTKT